MALDVTQLNHKYSVPVSEVGPETRERFSVLKKRVDKELSYLGIYTNEEGFEKTKTGAPRFFELAEDGTFKDALEGGADVKSDAFIEKLAKGTVFAFPAGQKEPVQIKAAYGSILLSEPLNNIISAKKPTEPVKPTEPKPLSGWRRFANAITFGRAYKQEVADYNKAMEQHTAAVEAYDRDIKQYRSDKAEYDRQTKLQEGLDKIRSTRAEADIAVEADRERPGEERKFQAARDRDYVSKLDAQLESLSNFYRPNPEKNEAYIHKPGEKGGVYTEEQFSTLTPIDLSGYRIGGKQITDDQFASLAICAAMQPEIGGKVRYEEVLADDPTFTLEDTAIHHATFYTSDLGMVLGKDGTFRPRENAGQYFENAVQPGREYAMMALIDYRLGRPEKLGTLIANAAKQQLNKNRHEPLHETAHLMNQVMVGRCAELLRSDPTLLAAAKQAGLQEHELWAMEGVAQMADVYRENERAETLLKLDSDALFTKGLSEQERADCIKARLRYEAVNESIRDHNRHAESSPEYQKAEKLVNDGMEEAKKPSNFVRGEGESEEEFQNRIITESEKNAAVLKAGGMKLSLIRNTKSGLPDVFHAAGGSTGIENLQELSEALLPGQDKLFALKGKDLENALDKSSLFGPSSPYAVKKEPEKQEPEKQKTVEKTVQQTKNQDIGF
ncbi:MAG: hypothetical protein IJV43_07760 [Oscillospiraceae bacterium]|nr:hypothetical protein [Oscillospiraceae bacterium]MBQ9720170.1 hypothetical protein [Oscillospiraceae bacterium]